MINVIHFRLLTLIKPVLDLELSTLHKSQIDKDFNFLIKQHQSIAYNHDWDQPNPRIGGLLTHHSKTNQK